MKLSSQQFRRTCLSVAIASCFTLPAYANPQGPTVVNGQANFSGQGNTLTITNTPGAIINWQSFSIAPNETTRFNQQNAASAVLNRVIGQDPSAILGSLSSNGRVFLINPNGIVFGQGAVVDVAGLVASTLNLSDQDFLSGKLDFTENAQSGSIKNQGAITTTSGGSVYLVAPNVENSGVITTPQGQIILAAGRSALLVDAGNPELQVTLTAPSDRVLNVGSLIAQAGTIGIFGALIEQRGIVNANSAVVGENGKIVLKATADITLTAGSETTANGPQGGQATVQSEAGTTLFAGHVSAKGSEGNGGSVQILGERVGLFGGAEIDVSGETGGGTALIGGDYQGNGTVQNAVRTHIASGASINADAVTSGDGGKVIVWADDSTRYDGRISARGGAESGNGGFVEVSGKENLGFAGSVDATAPAGAAGTLLLDPTNITVATGGTATLAQVDLFADPDCVAGGCTIAPATINVSLANVVLQANNDITVTNAIAMTNAGRSLTMQAGRDININANISTTNGAISLTANSPGASLASRSAGPGDVSMAAGTSIGAGNQNITLSVGNLAGGTPGNVTIGGNVATTGNVTLASSGGDLLRTAGTVSGNTVTLTAGGADGDVGTIAAPLQTNATTIAFTGTGTGDVAITEANGATVSGSTGSGPITLRSTTGNLTLGNNITSTGNVTLTATAGDLLRTAGTVTGNQLTLSAGGVASSIGTAGSNVQTTANIITATAGSGGVFITESNGANFTAMATGAGPLSLTSTTGTLTIASATSSGSGPIALTADDMAINAPVSSTGALTVQPVTTGQAINIAGGIGGLNLSAAEIANLTNGFSSITIGRLADGTGTVTVAGPVTFNDPVILVGSSIASNGTLTATPGNPVTLTARTGNITDGNGGLTNVVADSLTASAVAGIDLDTTIAMLASANVTGAGNINISDTAGGLAVTSAITANGNVNLNATGGDLTVTTVAPAGAGADATLTTTTSGNISLGLVTATGQVVLSSAGAITDNNGFANNVTANNLTATSATGIDLDTMVNATTTANVTGAGDIFLRDTAAPPQTTSANTANGNVALTDSNAIVLGPSGVLGDLSVTTGGNYTQTGIVDVGGAAALNVTGDVNLTAGAGPAHLKAASIGIQSTGNIALTGGAGAGSFAAVEATSGDAALTANAITLAAGGGNDADAVIIASNNLLINAGSCTGCNPLFVFPLGNGVTETGLFLQNLRSVPVTQALNIRDDELLDSVGSDEESIVCVELQTDEGHVIRCEGEDKMSFEFLDLSF
ncbi:MAG: beta strand repeat-containing protein [Burkholderiales bacterium]